MHSTAKWRPWALSCLYPLVLMNLAQVAAGLASVDPSPPLQVLPFIVATAAIGLFATALISWHVSAGYGVAIAFAVVSAVGMGPHKLFADDGLVIAPVALLGFGFELILVWAAVQCLRTR